MVKRFDVRMQVLFCDKHKKFFEKEVKGNYARVAVCPKCKGKGVIKAGEKQK